MKYILDNPEAFVSDIDEFGLNRVNSYGSFIRSEFADILNEVARSKVNGENEEADVTPVFEYYDNYSTLKENRSHLRNLFDIINIDDKEQVVRVKYRTERERGWSELEDKLTQYAPIQYSQEEKSKIVRNVLNTYIQDLQRRKDIIFECESTSRNEINIGGYGTQFMLEDKVYSINGEDIIVSTSFKALLDQRVMPPDYRVTDKEGSIGVEIKRKSHDGQNERFVFYTKSINDEEKESSVSCYYDKLNYSVDTQSDTNHKLYHFMDSAKGEYGYISEDKFKEISKDMLDLEMIDRLYSILINKIRFKKPDKSSVPKKKYWTNGAYEVGGWDDERPTNLDFEKTMSSEEIVERMQGVPEKELTIPNDTIEQMPNTD